PPKTPGLECETPPRCDLVRAQAEAPASVARASSPSRIVEDAARTPSPLTECPKPFFCCGPTHPFLNPVANRFNPVQQFLAHPDGQVRQSVRFFRLKDQFRCRFRVRFHRSQTPARTAVLH